MVTTELIKILQDNEIGGISHKPRSISLCINGRYMPEPQISLSSTGDGICGPEIDLDIEGDWLEEQLGDRCRYELNSTNGNPCYSCGKYKLTEQPATPQQKIGRWIKVHPLGMDYEAYMCSECKTGDWSVTVGEYKFCPYCGAEMEVEG